MWIDIDDAVRIYARMLRARLGSRRGAKAALETAVAAELAPPDQRDLRKPLKHSQ
jgi:hypothetical protein